jgi:hypothetical protein
LPCRFENQSAQVSVQCESSESTLAGKFAGTLDLRRGSGRIDYLTLQGSGTFSAVSLSRATSKSREQIVFRPAFRPDAAEQQRGADGNPLANITFHFSGADRTQGSATVETRQEFNAIEDAVTTLAESDAGAKLFAAGPFPREQLFAALFNQLGLPNISGCCPATEKLPPPQLEAIALKPENPSTNAADRALPAFYPYCATCHGGSESSPPNFLRGGGTQVTAQLRHCAPRLYVRLAMADVPPHHRDKTPMPPESMLPAFDMDIAGWRANPAHTALLAQVAEWLRTETGNAPDLNQMLAGGYENLRSCLPLH